MSQSTKMLEELKPLQVKLTEFGERLKHKLLLNIGEHKLLVHWIWNVVVWLCVWISLINVSFTSRAVSWISVGLLAVHVTNWLVQAVRSASPKALIKETSEKAVLITGMSTYHCRSFAGCKDLLEGGGVRGGLRRA